MDENWSVFMLYREAAQVAHWWATVYQDGQSLYLGPQYDIVATSSLEASIDNNICSAHGKQASQNFLPQLTLPSELQRNILL